MVKNRGMTEWFLGEEMKRRRNTEVRRQEAATELEAERRNIVNAMKYREPERGGPQTIATILSNQSFPSAELKSDFSALDLIKLYYIFSTTKSGFIFMTCYAFLMF